MFKKILILSNFLKYFYSLHDSKKYIYSVFHLPKKKICNATTTTAILLVLLPIFQHMEKKIPISEITLLLKNHQIWQYFKKGWQQWRMRQRLIEENRPLLPAFSTARPTWKLSSYIFHQIFSGKKGCTMGPFWTNSKYITLQCSTFYSSVHHLSHIRCVLSTSGT